jgi:outer membrane scaffolding protein for murein synthesis (MipA/OmpV family)
MVWLAALCLALGAAGARAQTPSSLSEWQYSVGVPLERLFEPEIPKWQVVVGVAGTIRPFYDGAQRYHFLAGPSIDIRYRDLFFASTGEGIGVNLVRADHWRAGLALTYDLGRRAQNTPEQLSGMGNINAAAEVKAFVDFVVSKSFPMVIRANIRRDIGGSNGWIGDLGAYLPLPGSTERFFWFAGPSVTFADARYTNTWFGVSPLQASRTRYAPYDAGAGVKSFGGGVSAVWFFHKHWFVTGDVGVSQLVGGALHSPITQKATNTSAAVSVNYQF